MLQSWIAHRLPAIPQRRPLLTALTAAWLAAIGCSSDHPPVTPGSAFGGATLTATVEANPYSVLSSIVVVSAAVGDSVRVVSVSTGDSTASPFFVVQSFPMTVTTLGLLASTTYTQIVQDKSTRRPLQADTLSFTTAALPSYVQRATLTQTQGTFSGGYTLVSPIGYTVDTALAVAFDSADRIRWYRLFPGRTSIEMKQQPNSNFTIYLNFLIGGGTSSANSSSANGLYVEFTPGGDSVTNYIAADGLPTDAHELWLQGSTPSVALATLFGVDGRVEDLTPIGGPPNTVFGGHWIFRVDPTGNPDFAWNAWDHFTIADCLLSYAASGGDFDHPNALDFDLDSNYIVSFRNLSAILKLNYQTGATIWQLGGTHNQFTFIGDPQALSFGGTSGQHGVRVLGNGHLLVYDNGVLQPTPHTRAVEYALDTVAKTATMVWEYVPNPPIFTVIVGSVQRLANGNTLIGFGDAGQIHEVDASATLLASANFQLNGVSTFYRANRLRSLYTYYPLNNR